MIKRNKGTRAHYGTVQKSSQEEKQKEIERHMLSLVYQYTRPNEAEDAFNRTIDYSGKKYVEQQASRDFFDRGVMNAQDIKLS